MSEAIIAQYVQLMMELVWRRETGEIDEALDDDIGDRLDTLWLALSPQSRRNAERRVAESRRDRVAALAVAPQKAA